MTLFLVFALILAVISTISGIAYLCDEGEPMGLIIALIGCAFFTGGMHQADFNKQAQVDQGNLVQYKAQNKTLLKAMETLRAKAATAEDRIKASEHALAETGKQLSSTRDKLGATSKVLVRTQDDLAKVTAESAVMGEQLVMCENTKAAYKVTLEEAEGKLSRIEQVLGE